MKHVSRFLPEKSEVLRVRERARLVAEARERTYLTEMIAIRFAAVTFTLNELV